MSHHVHVTGRRLTLEALALVCLAACDDPVASDATASDAGAAADSASADANVATSADASRDADTSDGADVPDLMLDRSNSLEASSVHGDTLAAASMLTSVFVKQDPTLTLAGDACMNAQAVAQRVSSATGGCASVVVSDCVPGASTATITASFNACHVGAATLSGSTVATIATTAANGSTTVSVALALNHMVLVELGKQYDFDGKLSISTTDLQTYTLSADLANPDYHWTFDGTVAASESTEGKLLAVTLDGAGTLAGVEDTETSGAYTCVCDSLSYTVAGLHRDFAQCHADGGSIKTLQQYTCTATTPSRPQKPGRTVSVEAAASDSFTWSEATPQTGVVHVEASLTIANQTTSSSSDVTLPACP